MWVERIGLVTPVGLGTASSVASYRAGVMRFGEVPFHDLGGNLVFGGQVPVVADGRQGLRRLVALLAAAVDDACSGPESIDPSGLPLIVATSREDRPGCPPNLRRELISRLIDETGWKLAQRGSLAVPEGATGIAHCLAYAQQALDAHDRVLVAAVDSLIRRDTIRWLDGESALKTDYNPDGVIPSEGAGCLVVSRRPRAADPMLEIAGVGMAQEPAERDFDRPMIGLGLTAAVRDSLSKSSLSMEDVHFRVADVTGERRRFSEAVYVQARTLNTVRDSFPLWLPAESFGDMGAALGPALVAATAMGFRKGYAPGPAALSHHCSRTGERAALVLRDAGAVRG